MGFKDFGWALAQLRNGKAVHRKGWNGRDMFLILIPGSTFTVTEGRPLAAHIPAGQEVQYLPHIDLRTVSGALVPWLAAQADMLGEDWEVRE